MDPLNAFKVAQKAGWAFFAPLEMVTMLPATRLVKFARVEPGHHLLDVACGTGVVAITARRLGPRVVGLDLTCKLLERARYNSQLAGMEVEWVEGDAEDLPFDDEVFDIVLSQFGHIFAPRPALVLSEMLRVLKPGGTIAFSVWPAHAFVGRSFGITSRYMPPPPPGVASPIEWGDESTIRKRFGDSVTDILFETEILFAPALSPQHHRTVVEQTAGPLIKLVETLSKSDPSKLAAYRREFEALAAEYFQDNRVRQDYLMARGTKK